MTSHPHPLAPSLSLCSSHRIVDKFLLGNCDNQIEEADGVRAMMLLSGSVQLADITTIRANSYMFERISKCKEESLSCDGKNEEVWPDIKVVFKLL